MRVSLFFILFCSVYLYGGEHSQHMNPFRVHFSFSQELAKLNQFSFQNFDDNNSIEETDLEILEEAPFANDTTNKFLELKYKSVANYLFTSNKFLIPKNEFKGIKNFQSFFGYSQPIYFSNRVLRI